MRCPVLIGIDGAERCRVARAELEDIANLDPVLESKRLAACKARITGSRRGDVDNVIGGEVARNIDVLQVVAMLVGPRDEVWGGSDERVNDDGCALRADRRGVPGLHARSTNLLLAGRAKVACPERIRELRLFNIIIAAHDCNNKSGIAIGKEDGLGGALSTDTELRGKRLDRWGVRCRHLLDRLRRLCCRCRTLNDCNLAIRSGAARITDDERVFAMRARSHELVCQRAAHHSHIACNGKRPQAEAGEDPRIGVVVEVVRALEASLVTICRVGILHRELPHADEATTRSGLVAPLRLEVIHLLGELAPRADQLA